jgi:hypothetical protein
VLHLAYTMHLGQGPDAGALMSPDHLHRWPMYAVSSVHETDHDCFAGANIAVEVQPLQLTYQPQALTALSAFLGGMPSDTHSSAVLAAINALDNPVARTLAKARRAWSPGPGNSLTIQVTAGATSSTHGSMDGGRLHPEKVDAS